MPVPKSVEGLDSIAKIARLLLVVVVSFPFSFQLFTRLAAVFAEEVDCFGAFVFYGPI